MRVSFYGYNAFVIEGGGRKVVIDPGALFLYYFRMTTLIPKPEWQGVSHILVTHGDPDHYWHTDRVARVSGAPVIMNRTMVREVNGKALALGPRDRGLAFTTAFDRCVTLGVDERVVVDGVPVVGIKATHGPLTLKLGPFAKTVTPGANERVGWGAMGFQIELDGLSIVNLGDTLLHSEAWRRLVSPDLLMIPIGGGAIGNTMNEEEALQAVEVMAPKLVIPCHYNCPAFFTRNYNPADAERFSQRVMDAGYRCEILQAGQSLALR